MNGNSERGSVASGVQANQESFFPVLIMILVSIVLGVGVLILAVIALYRSSKAGRITAILVSLFNVFWFPLVGYFSGYEWLADPLFLIGQIPITIILSCVSMDFRRVVFNEKEVIEEQVKESNQEQEEPKNQYDDFQENSNQSQDGNVKSDDDFSYDSRRFADDRFTTPQKKHDYVEAYRIMNDPTAETRDRAIALKFSDDADKGNIDGILPLLPAPET